MSKVVSWKDPCVRFNVAEDESHPGGNSKLSLSALEPVMGAGTQRYWSLGCCGGATRGDCGNTAVNCVTLNKTPCPTAYATCTC